MKIIYLTKIEQDQNEYRFYRLALPPGARTVHKLWGRVHEYATERWETLDDAEAAEKHFKKVLREKKRDGYQETDEKVLPKNLHIYVPPPTAATERPSDGQLSLFEDG